MSACTMVDVLGRHALRTRHAAKHRGSIVPRPGRRPLSCRTNVAIKAGPYPPHLFDLRRRDAQRRAWPFCCTAVSATCSPANMEPKPSKPGSKRTSSSSRSSLLTSSRARPSKRTACNVDADTQETPVQTQRLTSKTSHCCSSDSETASLQLSSILGSLLWLLSCHCGRHRRCSAARLLLKE